MYKNKLLLTILVFAASVSFIPRSYGREAGQPGQVALKVAELVQNNTSFKETNLFYPAASQSNEQLSSTISQFSVISIQQGMLQNILDTKPEFLKLKMPAFGVYASKTVLLYKITISGNGFTLQTSDGRSFQELNTIVHYRGMVENDVNSVVSFSFSNEETMGMISTNEGNFVVGEIENGSNNGYVYYNDKDLVPVFSYECVTDTKNAARQHHLPPANNNQPGILTTNCVDWYYEIDNDIYVGKGSNLSNVNSYIQGAFNQVSTLYNNDGVSITLQTLFVWTSTDPYTGSSTSSLLNQFGAYRTSFAGDLANLVGYNGGGGIAYLDGLCGSTQYKMGYMGISSSYNTVPTYSWTVEVITHEDGHLLGSHHTHDCVWNGNNTAIDGCGDAAGYNGSGSCATGPLPTSGTIMSYCHLVSGVGINFNNGFGPQPLAVILSNVNTAACLSACTTCTTPAQPGTITGATSYCGVTSQTYSVTAVAGATSYTWTKPSGWTGTSTTNSITLTTTTTGGTISVTANNACGSSSARTLTVSPASAPSQPGTISGSASVCQGSSQTYSVSSVSGATSYAWSLPSGFSGTSSTNSISVVPGATGGTVSVAAVNSCGTGTARTLTVSINALPGQPSSISGTTTVCPATSYQYSVSSVSGATSYTWTLPSGWSGSSTTNTINVTSGSAGGTLTVTANNSCGSGQSRTQSVTMSVAPAQPGTITATGGNTKVCPGSTKTYSIAVVAGATAYNWIPPVGSTISSGQGSPSVVVNFNSGFVASDSIKVSALNGCASSPTRGLKITRNTPVKPGTISGSLTNVCNASSVPYSVTNVGGITYAWSFNTGSATVSSGQGTNSIAASFNPNYTSGILSVTASNACGTSAARTTTISAAPGQPGAMTGPSTACAGQSGVPYSIPPVAGATSYTWTVPSGAHINDGTVTSATATLTTTANAVTVNFGTTAGNVRVKATNPCGTGSNRSLNVTFNCRVGNEPVAINAFDAQVYPNPADDQITISFESVKEAENTIRITDVTGKTHLVLPGKSNEGINEIAIDIKDLTPGIYFLEIINGDQSKVAKISVR